MERIIALTSISRILSNLSKVRRRFGMLFKVDEHTSSLKVSSSTLMML